MTPLEKISKARAQLIIGQPFFGALVLKLGVKERPEIKTMATDGKDLFFNPAYVEGLTLPELTGVCAHEAMHCVLDHVDRLNGRDLGRFNSACDYAVNPIIIDAGMTLPGEPLVNPAYDGMTADKIYNLLPPPQEPQDGDEDAGGTGQGGDDPGGCGGILPPPDDQSPAEAQALKQSWKIATIQAAAMAQACGMLPASMKQLIEEFKKPKIDWREQLRFFITSALPSDYAWFPPNRRYVAQGLYLPALKPDRIARVGVFIDSSGSTWQAIPSFADEFNAILEDVRPDAVYAIYCDAAVNSVEEIEADDYPVKMEAHGGGGTDFRPPFAHVEREGIELDCAIYLTDGECNSYPDVAPDYPVLWVSTGPMRPPFGMVVPLDL